MIDVVKSVPAHQVNALARIAQTSRPIRANPATLVDKSAPALQDSAHVKIAQTRSRPARELVSRFVFHISWTETDL